jgi:flagellar hook-associated protein 3 FlgL
MRISSGMTFDAGVSSINKQTATLLHLQQQVASGRRILSPSDDPVAAARALEVTQSQEITAQFKLTHNNANSALGLEEAQLSSATDLLARVRELTVQAGNTTLSSSDRRAITSELRARFEELIGISNATDGAGQYLFSGFMGATKPFGGSVESILAGGEIVYSGDDGQRKLQVSPARFLEVSDSGNDVFKRIRNGNGDFVTDYPKNGLGVGTNTGTATIDAGSITDPAAWNARPTNNFSINFSVDNTVVPPVTYYDIVDTTSGNSMLTGAPPTLPPTAATGQRAYQSGQPITLKNQGAEPAFDFGGNVVVSGTPASGDSFSVAPSSSQSIFASVAKLIGAMENATTGSSAASANLANDIGFALTNLDKATDNILRVRAQIGSRMAEIDSLSSVNEDLNLQYQQTLSELQDLDYAKSISDLTRKQTDLQAAQQSFVMMSKLSLFNYL